MTKNTQIDQILLQIFVVLIPVELHDLINYFRYKPKAIGIETDLELYIKYYAEINI